MKHILYLLPFLFFISGYYTLAWITHVTTAQVPPLVGLSLTEAVLRLAEQQLNVRVLAFHEEPDIAPGTIVSQIPSAGSAAKPQQRVFVVIAKEPEVTRAPSLVGIDSQQAQQSARKQGLQVQRIVVAGAGYPHDMVIAQAPQAGEAVNDGLVIIYVAGAQQAMVVMPNFVGMPVADVQRFCAEEGGTVQISYASARDELQGVEQCRVRDQRPLPGSIVELGKGLKIQLSVAAQR